MEKSKLAYITDEIMRTAAIWLLSAICIRYAIKELYLIILIATAVTMLITMLLRIRIGKKSALSAKLKKQNDTLRELMVYDRNKLLRDIALSIQGTVSNDAVLKNDITIFPYFYAPLQMETLSKMYVQATNDNRRLLVLCGSVSAEVEKNIDLFDNSLSILTGKRSYDFLIGKGLNPPLREHPKKKKRPFKALFKKSKIKGYLTTSIILLITATFSPYSLLCVFLAAFNVAMSIVCEVIGE